MLQKLSKAIAIATLISLGITGKVHAVSLTESADAGEFLFNAGNTDTQPTGTSLTGITGNINPGGDIDLFQIFIPVGTFTASTVGGTDIDSQLFLFDSSGIGVVANNDNFPSLQSTISISISSAGNYYFGISTVGFNPQSSGGPIFTIDPITGGVADPSNPGSGSSSPLSSWSADGFPETGGYSINVSGAEFVGPSATAVPFEFNPTLGVLMLTIWSAWELKKRKK